MLQDIREEVESKNATLVAVSKTKTEEQIRSVYDAGQRHFAENRAKELSDKQAQLPDDIVWHMVGHLQKNKVKFIASFVTYIHSVDSLDLIEMIERQASKHNRVIKVLLQVKIAQEESKYGIHPEELRDFAQAVMERKYEHVDVCGLMGMATFTDNENQISKEFALLNSLFHHLKTELFKNETGFKELSMGMSGDYKIALSQGSTMVRIGSLIFGARNY